MKKIKINFVIQNEIRWHGLPPYPILYFWLKQSLLPEVKTAEITLRIVSAEESGQLNARFRQQDKPTNILSFCYPGHGTGSGKETLVGDLAFCPEIFEREILVQGRTPAQHFAHLFVHGLLHLQGFDHENDQDAEKMEQMEILFLQQLGFENPYLLQD